MTKTITRFIELAVCETPTAAIRERVSRSLRKEYRTKKRRNMRGPDMKIEANLSKHQGLGLDVYRKAGAERSSAFPWYNAKKPARRMTRAELRAEASVTRHAFTLS